MPIAIICSLLAGLLYAWSALLQRQGAGNPEPHELFSKKFAAAVSKNRVWLMGLGLQIATGGLEAIALYNGTLVLVEPLLTTDLVFLLMILHFNFGIKAGPREWLGVAGICTGLSILLIAANPQSGQTQYDGIGWALTGCSVAVLIALGIFIARHTQSGVWRAGVSATAAGIGFGLSAALIKLVMQQLQGGVGAVLTGWAVYALVVTAILATLIMQSAYGAGPLVVTQPVLEIVNPVVGVVIGMLLFGDRIATTLPAMAAESVGAALAVTGIILMGTSKRIIGSPVKLKISR